MSQSTGATPSNTSTPTALDSSTLAEAQAAANELAARFTTDQTLTPAERSNLVADMKVAARRLDELKRGPQ